MNLCFLIQTGWVSETIPTPAMGELIDFGQISFQTYPDPLRLVVFITLLSFGLGSIAVATARRFRDTISDTIGEGRLHSLLEKSKPVLIRSGVFLGYLATIVMLGFFFMLAYTFLYG